MAVHSITEAKNRLSKLIDRALRGEDVVITRRGHPVVELRPISAPPHGVTAADLDWLAARRVGRKRTAEDAGRLLTALRDAAER